MDATRRRQTTAALAQGLLSLPVSYRVQDVCNSCADCTRSPYFQMTDTRKEAPGRDTTISTIMIKGFIIGYAPDGTTADALVLFEDNSNGNSYVINVPLTIGYSDTDATIQANVESAINDYCSSQLSFTPSSLDWTFSVPSLVAAQIAAAIPPAPSSYQTIVSQTGTAAPAVSGSLSPMSTYLSGTTFTWARTGAGVYTLTASTAVFNTSGKTGVFVGTLNNLNASCKAVVTSSTVITLTTAIGSLLGLGLLGLTAINTDALMSQTMVYVQTYP